MSTEATLKLSEISISDPDSVDTVIDLREHFKTIQKHRWSILLVTALITALAAHVVSGMTPQFQATSTLLIETEQKMTMNLEELIGIDTNNKEYYQTQFEVLRSRKLAKRVIHEMGLYSHHELHSASDGQSDKGNLSQDNLSNAYQVTGKPSPVEIGSVEAIQQQMSVNRFLARLSIKPVKNTKLVRITYMSSDPVLAAQVANKVADSYILSYLDSRIEMGEKTSQWLSERLIQHKLTLEASQNTLLAYKEQNGLIDIQGGVGQLTEQEIGIVTSKLIDSEGRMAHAKILFDDVKETRKRGPQALLGLPVIDSNEMVRRFKIDQQEAKFNLDELSNRYGDKHPKVIDAQSRYETARSNLNSQIYNIVDTIEKEYTLAQHSVASLRSTLDDGKKEIQEVGRSRIELMHLEREVELNQKMYDTFYTRMREVDEAENISTTNAQISEYAEAPLGPVKPRKKLLVLLTMVLALLGSVASAILAELMNNKVTSTENVEDDLSLRMLGIVPRVTKRMLRKAGASNLVPGIKLQDRGNFAESIRTIRTSLCLNELKSSNQVIMVTSALPAEGKSTLASHLAHSFSQLENVLLLECDLRRPSLHHTLDFSDDDGLSALLGGEAKFRQCIKVNAIDSLDIIPAGNTPENPLELLSSVKFTHLIQQMKKRYDRIIIDSAPVQAVSDALILGQIANAVIYTVKANSTDLEVSARGIDRMREAGINMVGAVVTQVDIRKTTAGYGGDLQYQGYYDYYGYSGPVVQKSVKTAEKPVSLVDAKDKAA